MKGLGLDNDSLKEFRSKPPKKLLMVYQTLLKKLKNCTASEMRIWTTLIFFSRGIQTEPEPDIKTIIEPHNNEASVNINIYKLSMKASLNGFWKGLNVGHRWKVPKKVSWNDFHFTTKAGPNGQAMASMIKDYLSLTQSQLEDIKVLGGPKFRENLKHFEMEFLPRYMMKFMSDTSKTGKGITRKIAYFSDQEGKTRVIGILDYFSQSVLKPLHKWLFNRLKVIPQDCTFSQGKFREHIRSWDNLYSCDLTAATDRLPIFLSKRILEEIFPSE
jgi:hypothetical protein